MKLHTPIEMPDGRKIEELEFKEPTGAMFLRHGDLEIAKISRDGGAETVTVETNMKALVGYIQDCCGIPEPIIRTMTRRDIAAARAVLQGMFQD